MSVANRDQKNNFPLFGFDSDGNIIVGIEDNTHGNEIVEEMQYNNFMEETEYNANEYPLTQADNYNEDVVERTQMEVPCTQIVTDNENWNPVTEFDLVEGDNIIKIVEGSYVHMFIIKM